MLEVYLRKLIASFKTDAACICFLMLSVWSFGILNSTELQAKEFSPKVNFISRHCADCHSPDFAEGGFDASKLQGNISEKAEYDRWVQIYDRVAAREMPPSDASELTDEERQQFLLETENWLTTQRNQQFAELGRVQGRRLNNLQLERSLHDLMGIDIPLKVYFPEEQMVDGFTSVADGQTMSHFQLEKHLKVVDLALDEAFEKGLYEDDSWTKTLDANTISRTRPKSRTREPEMLDGLAVTWSSGLTFYGRLPATTAKEDGWYRFTVRGKSLKQPEDSGVWCTVRSGRHVSSSPIQKWIGAFEATPEMREWTFEAWLNRGEMIEIRPGDNTLKKGRFAGGQVGAGEGGPQDVPGIALESIVMEKFHKYYSPEECRQVVIGNLSKSWDKTEKRIVLESKTPEEDLRKLMEAFATRAFRRPLESGVLDPYYDIALSVYKKDSNLLDALRLGYRAILCSPRFVYLQEEPGQLDDYEIASRLSYFLWNTMPDEQLLKLAAQKKLTDKNQLKLQVNRMLNDPRGHDFVRDFADEWLDMRLIDFTEPDRRMFPKFDVVVQQSMVEETVAFLQNLLSKNLPVTQLIDSDTTYLNSRLARYYNIDQQLSDELVPVKLDPKSNRGGLITQGSILKITANGTTTSPVVRGVWISERILGQPIPPVPSGIPAIEPDVRGATTIREMLEKHKSDPSCASCHVKIDPPGFALENFDPAGQWRDNYGKPKKKSDSPKSIDTSAEFVDGRKFETLDDFQRLVVAQPEKLAANVAEKMITCGTGASVDFTDRDEIEEIVSASAKQKYGFRTILEEVVTSPLFLTK
ncbi:DUF1592 domain-containing protein [Rubinisphaera sp.]|uniref:DUF1592 domain-containing protein n=1 Tax=Rubinisphaera sp. TaxID=2024857 RepID=UPI0025FC6C2F|nr:DUF1592 domain-containing protein [Rubinisphaera sp.]